jgi:Rrf2 family protein
MKLSTKGRYALRSLIDLAHYQETGEKTVSLKEIARRQEISVKYLEAIFTVLKNVGILKSKRGANGGYYLARLPQKINALEVVEAIEGPISIVECCINKTYCDKTATCKTIKLWKETNDQITGKLKSCSVQDLM